MISTTRISEGQPQKDNCVTVNKATRKRVTAQKRLFTAKHTNTLWTKKNCGKVY